MKANSFRRAISRTSRALFSAIVLIGMLACGGDSSREGATEPAAGGLGLGGLGALVALGQGSNAPVGVLEAEALLDGRSFGKQLFTPGATTVYFMIPETRITPGRHRLELKVIRQLASPTSYFAIAEVAVLNLSTGSSQQFALPRSYQVSLRTGEAAVLDFVVENR
jgi:hypothetical protein